MWRNRPWCMLGDFNAALNLEDMSSGSSNIDISMREFKDCVEEIEMMDVHRSGLMFTWNQKPKGSDGVLKKIDRVMANLEFNDVFAGSYAVFQPYRISDHAPCVLKIPLLTNTALRPFKFANFLVHNDRFKDVVKEGWLLQVSGFCMFRVVKKLKILKKPLRKLLFAQGNLNENVKSLRLKLDRVQKDLDVDPTNVILREEEAAYVQAFNNALLMQERFLMQKAKIEWLKVGDSNSAYFHKSVKSRISRSRINVITNVDGTIFTDDQVASAFVSHYEEFLGSQGPTTPFCSNNLFLRRLDVDIAADMVRPVIDLEIKEAMFSMGNDKSPGPDGFTAAFFKEAWDIVASDVINAVKEFFVNGTLLKELNHTIIALIPKVSSPTRINDYRPISCCNVLFKCISKIISNRIKGSLKVLVSSNQSAFMPGRRISDNILLTQELMHNYHLDRGTPRCAFKVDIQKAYDTVDWDFLKTILEAFGFHSRMIGWIMECVATTSFSLSINGVLHGYFKGKRGLRQGDPISPYLFTLVMEVLTLMLQRRVRDSGAFTFHRYCSEMDLINLCFADDLFLFAHGDVDSARVIMEALDEFKLASGLTPSIPKSTAYFCNVLNYIKISILHIMPFEEGRLPVKYLGVPLVSSRLLYRDCKELIEKVHNRIKDWRNKSLSAAGRLQLVQSVIGSMHVYWASVFILPTRMLLEIEQLMRGFLWCQGTMRKGKSKVAWEVVCLPKHEGGLGLRRLELFNKALMIAHIWSLLSHKESLWVKWIHTYKLRGRSFWDVPLRGNMTWGWRKILQLRPIIREFIWHKVGNGSNVSAWFDKWVVGCPLADTVSVRDMYRAGFDLKTKLSEVIIDNVWRWPTDWSLKYPNIISLPVPMLQPNDRDCLEWRDDTGMVKPFSVAVVWECIRPRNTVVPWFNVVWFSEAIPRHAFLMWLVIKGKLNTQDKMVGWNTSLICPLCESQPDSHTHLFFECSFSDQVWSRMKVLAGLSTASSSISDVVDQIVPISKRRQVRCIIAKLVIAACAYFIWQERNWRLFRLQKRTVAQVIECIKSSVRLKLLSCSFKMSKAAKDMLTLWQLPETIICTSR
ncbi:hypothetical protein Tco_0154335 [Tanacetum coccineum]